MVGTKPVCETARGSLEQGLGLCNSALRHVGLGEKKQCLADIGTGVRPPGNRFGHAQRLVRKALRFGRSAQSQRCGRGEAQ